MLVVLFITLYKVAITYKACGVVVHLRIIQQCFVAGLTEKYVVKSLIFIFLLISLPVAMF